MGKSKKNLIIQIFWIIAIGIIIWFAYAIYSEQNPKQVVEPQKVQSENKTFEKLCMERAIEKANEFGKGQEELADSGNPYLLPDHKKFIPQWKEKFKIKEYSKCMDIWGD